MAHAFGAFEQARKWHYFHTAQPGQRDLDTRQLCGLVTRMVVEHRFSEAAAAVAVLFRRPRACPELMFQAALLVLRANRQFKRSAIKLYELIIDVSVKERKPLLVLEFAIFLAENDDLSTAVQVMETCLPTSPFHEDPLMHGYCGLFEAAMAARAGQPTIGGGVSLASVHTSRALAHLRRAVQLRPETDMFAAKIVQLLLDNDYRGDALQVAQDLLESDPRNPNAHRILFQLLDRCFPDHMDAKLAVLRELALVDPVAEELVQIPKLLLEEPADIVGLASPELVVERVTKAGSRALRKKFKDEPMSDSATSGSEVPEEVRRKAFLGTTKHSATTAWLLVVSPRTEVFATVNGDARTVASAWQRSMAPFTNTKLFACLRRPCPSRSFAVEWSARRGLNQWHCGSSLPRCCQPFPKGAGLFFPRSGVFCGDGMGCQWIANAHFNTVVPDLTPARPAFCLLAAWRHRTFSVGKTVFVGGDRFLLAQTAHQHHYGQQR
eukprot:m.391323 g.391323  ORF g.391323 m.391323 type:complete len:494 (-) comp20080_c0_seq18:2572-4053(-)